MTTLRKADIEWAKKIYERHQNWVEKMATPERVLELPYEMAYGANYNHEKSGGCETPERVSATLFPSHGYYGAWAFFKNGYYVCSLDKSLLEVAVSENAKPNN